MSFIEDFIGTGDGSSVTSGKRKIDEPLSVTRQRCSERLWSRLLR